MSMFSRFTQSIPSDDTSDEILKAFADARGWSVGQDQPAFTFHGPCDTRAEFPVPIAFADYDPKDVKLHFWTRHKGSCGVAYTLRPAAAMLSQLDDKLLGSVIKVVELSGPRQVPISVGIEKWPTVRFTALEIQELKLTAEAITSANEIDGMRTEPFSILANAQFVEEFMRDGALKQARSIALQLRL